VLEHIVKPPNNTQLPGWHCLFLDQASFKLQHSGK